MDEPNRPTPADGPDESTAPRPAWSDEGVIPLAPETGPPPPPRPIPVRPDFTRPTAPPPPDAPAPAQTQDRPRATPPRVSTAARRCGLCGYDLRGDPRAIRCPECGAEAPAAADLPPDPATERERVVGMWQSLGTAAFAIVALLSPLPFLGAAGLVLASCAAFAIGFRLLALRGLEAVPTDARAALEPTTARFRAALVAEGIAAGALVAYALLSTAALAPIPVGFARAILVPAWAVLAVRSLIAQQRLASAFLEATGAPDAVEAKDLRATTALLVAGVGLVAGALAGGILGSALDGSSNALPATIGRAASTGALVALLLAPVIAAAAALRLRALSTTVSESVFECDWFRSRRRRGDDDLPDGGDDDDDAPPARKASPRRPGSPFVPPDDTPIPLA